MALTMSATEARAALHELLLRGERGDEVTITRHGRPVAVVVRPDSLRARRAGRLGTEAAGIRDRLEAGRAQPLAGSMSIRSVRADALVAEIRSGRDDR